MTTSTVVPCWRVFGWGKGRWTLRSTHRCPDEAREHAEALFHRTGTRTRVEQTTTVAVTPTAPPAPSTARRFRESQADRMVLRRQATAYFKSGSNGTEIPQPLHDTPLATTPGDPRR